MTVKTFRVFPHSLVVFSVRTLCCAFLLYAAEALGATPRDSLDSLEPSANGTRFTLSKAVKISGFLGGGIGFEKTQVMTVENIESGELDTATLSAGGGWLYQLGVEYGVSELLSVQGVFGGRTSTLSALVANADGSFSRIALLGSVKFHVYTSKAFMINVGGGGGLFMNGTWDVDASDDPDGAHTIIEYGVRPGFHVVGEYVRLLPLGDRLSSSIDIGLKYTNTTYNDPQSLSIDGVSQPTRQIPDTFDELNGSGLTLYVGWGVIL